MFCLSKRLKGGGQKLRKKDDKDFLEIKCNRLGRQIDKLVYKLYEMTEDEKQIGTTIML